MRAGGLVILKRTSQMAGRSVFRVRGRWYYSKRRRARGEPRKRARSFDLMEWTRTWRAVADVAASALLPHRCAPGPTDYSVDLFSREEHGYWCNYSRSQFRTPQLVYSDAVNFGNYWHAFTLAVPAVIAPRVLPGSVPLGNCVGCNAWTEPKQLLVGWTRV